MKKLLPILALFALMLVPWVTQAQTVTIGDGTSVQSTAPVANYYNYSMAEMIFTADEIAAGNPAVSTILSVGFECASSVNKEYGITIYMKNVEADAFTDASEYVALTDDDVVYSGTLTPTSGWTTIELDAPFTYDNTQNLLIAVNKTSGGYSSNTSIWKYTSTSTTYRMLWKQNDGSAYDPTATPSLDLSYNRPNVQLTFGTPSACSKPSGITVSDITANSATIGWTPNSDETAWQISINDEVVGTSNSTTYTVTGLDAATTYTVGVAAVCSPADITSAVTTNFRTAYAGQYITVADGTATNDYIPIYGSWVDAAQHNQVLYPASMLEGLAGNNLTGFVFYLSQVASTAWGTTVTISLSEVSDESISALIEADLTQVWQGTANGTESEWFVNFDSPYLYTGGNLLVDITTTAASYKNASFYGLAVNDKSVHTRSNNTTAQSFLPKTSIFYEESDVAICYRPTNVEVVESSESSLTLSWTPGGQETQWQLYLNGEPAGVSSQTTFTFNNLASFTQYTLGVQALCSDGGISIICSTTARTLCNGTTCNITAELSGTLYTSSYSNGAINVYQSGAIVGTLNQSTLSVEVCSSMPVELRHSSESTWSEGTAIVRNGGGGEVFNGTTGGGTMANDSLLATVEMPCPSCFVPTNMEVSNLSDQGFTLSWTPGAQETEWQITLTPADGESVVYYAQTTSYTFSQLADNTEYSVEVRSDCGNDGLSGAATATVTTPMSGFEPATVPYQTGFGPNDDQYWQFVNGENNIWVVNNDNLYITESSSETLENSYDNSALSVSYAYRQMEIEETAIYYFQFDYKGKGEGNYDYMRAWVAPASAEFTADKLPNGSNSGFSSYTTTNPAGWYDLGGKMNQKSDWTHVDANIELTAGSYKLVFMWCNDGSSGDNPPAAVDNLSINQINEILISARANDETMGIVEGYGLYTYGENVTLTAVPASDNYYFTQWSTGETTPTITITADLAAQATEYIAYFEANVATINGYAHNQLGGMVEGSGEYANGDEVTLTATADEGWHFSRWSDGNTDNPRTITATVNMSLEAYFVHNYDMTDGVLNIDFDETDGAQYFDMSNAGRTNQWAIGQTNEMTHMNQALIISNDGGQTNAYTQGQTAAVFAWVNVTLEPGLYDYSYDWKNQGGYSHYLRACLVPASVATEGAASMPTGWGSYTFTLPTNAIALDSAKNLYNNTTWRTMGGSFELAEGGDYKLVFFWYNNSNTVYTDNAAAPAVDNIYLYHNTEPIGLIAYGDRQRGWVETDQGEYYYGDTATLTAVANDGYIFDRWSTGETTETITVPVNLNTMNVEYIAYFDPANPTLYVYYSANLGNVSGINAESNSISVARGDSVTLEATAYEGYVFGGWSDGSFDNPHTIVLTDNMTLECRFLEPLESLNVDFENGDGNIEFLNGYCTNKWVVGMSADGGNTSLFVSNDGMNNTYTNTSTSNVFAYYTVMLNPGVYEYSYDWLCNGESNYDYLRVALVPAETSLEASTSGSIWGTSNLPAGVIALDGGSKLNQQNSWQSFSGSVEVPEGGLYKLAFYWRNDNSSGDDAPAAVDNINFYNTHVFYPINAYGENNLGFVDGAGEHEYGEVVTLTAWPSDTSYRFYQWADGLTEQSRQVTALPGIEEQEFVAIFVPNRVEMQTFGFDENVITVTDAEGNSYAPNTVYHIPGGQPISFTVNAVTGYDPTIEIFDLKWTSIASNTEAVDGSVSLEFTPTANFNAFFSYNMHPFTVTVETNDPQNATAIGSGTYYLNDIAKIMVAPKRGYQFARWTDDTVADNYREVTVNGDMSFSAIVEPIICLPDTEFVTETVYVDSLIHDTTYVEVSIHDTTYVDVHDTTYVDVHDTTYVDVHDTTYVDVHDTTYVDVHDTTYVDVHDTTYVDVHDTTYVDVHDTTYVDVHDTTYVEVPIHDTTYVAQVDTVYDTTYITQVDTVTNTVYDTVTNTEYIYDTVTNTIYDTLYSIEYVHDTTMVGVDTLILTEYVHDTTTVFDTITLTQVDTITNTEYVHDTTIVTETHYDTVINTEYVNVLVHDTMYVNRYIYDSLYFYDTTFVHDTTYINIWKYDTTYVTVNDSIIETLVDTVYLIVNDTTQINNFIHDSIYFYVHDTTIVTNYDTLTVTKTVIDSVILNNYIHDTTIVTNTVYDTVTLTQTDTIVNTVYDTVTNTEYVYDTVTNTVYDTITLTQTDTVTLTQTDTITNTEYIYDTITNTVYDTTLLTDTLWLTDTLVIYVHDTVYVHDTIYVGIEDEATMTNVKLYQRDGQIVVEGAEGARVMLFDAVGRQLATKTDEYDVLRFDVPATGAYLIKVGDAPARRIVVVR